jgi:serine phosphatase RsbU (regulator of sigma subunit)
VPDIARRPEPPGRDARREAVSGAVTASPAGTASPADAASPADTLRDIQSLTDAALSALDPQAILVALVERAKKALDADTAAILLLNKPSGHLVATAASGLEEEVRQGTQVPVGKGFAGRIAQEDAIVILDEVDHTRVVNPLLLARGIRSLMGAPLRAGGEVIGVIHVGTLTRREFTSYDADLLQLAADRAALAVQALDTQLDRAAAVALQRSLVPAALPQIGGLQLAARYVPGSGVVGGDWYDVFRLPSGLVCAVIGDVAGSGIRAAAIMGRIRSALRAYALETCDPAEILERLDRKVQHFEPEALATILCAVISPDSGQVVLSCAGHLPPVLACPGEAAQPAEIAADLLIGVPGGRPRRSTVLEMPAGATLCLYTDGLVERRGEVIDDGIRALCAAITTTEPEAACASLMAALAPRSAHIDDMALLLLRFSSAA